MTTREQRIESVGESYEPAPAPRYSDRELSRQLAVATRALGRAQIDRGKLEAENVRLKAALLAVFKTEHNHDLLPLRHNCPGCDAEHRLMKLMDELDTQKPARAQDGLKPIVNPPAWEVLAAIPGRVGPR